MRERCCVVAGGVRACVRACQRALSVCAAVWRVSFGALGAIVQETPEQLVQKLAMNASTEETVSKELLAMFHPFQAPPKTLSATE